MRTRGDEQAKFYGMHRKMTEASDLYFLKKYGEDLNTTLIFVSLFCRVHVGALIRLQAGLFSAVTSAFIIETGSKLQPKMAEEVVYFSINQSYKTAFGNYISTLR